MKEPPKMDSFVIQGAYQKYLFLILLKCCEL